jgi:hypothetical protein
MTPNLPAIAAANEERKKLYSEVAHVGDGGPWAWLSYGEKCYAFAVVEAFHVDDDTPATGRLRPHPEKERTCVDASGRECMILNWICDREEQDGGKFCRFVAGMHNDPAASTIDELLAEVERLRVDNEELRKGRT